MCHCHLGCFSNAEKSSSISTTFTQELNLNLELGSTEVKNPKNTLLYGLPGYSFLEVPVAFAISKG